MRELGRSGTPDGAQFTMPRPALIDRGYRGYVEMGIRRAREKDPGDLPGAMLRAVAVNGPMQVFDAARVIVEEQVDAGIPVERDSIAQTAQQIEHTAATLDFFHVYQDSEEGASVAMHPKDARIIRQSLIVAERQSAEEEIVTEDTTSQAEPVIKSEEETETETTFPPRPSLLKVLFQRNTLPLFHPEDAVVRSMQESIIPPSSEAIETPDSHIELALDMH